MALEVDISSPPLL